MRRTIPALAALLLASCAAPSGPVGSVRLAPDNPIHAVDEAEGERVRMAGPQMLFWPSDIRMARFREMERNASESHMSRLASGKPETLATSSLHLDVIRDLKRINSHLTSVAYPILDAAGELARTRLKSTEA